MRQVARDFPSFLFFSHVVNYVSFASAAPGQWFTRRDCESVVCPLDWDIAPLINGAVGGVLDWWTQSDPPGLTLASRQLVHQRNRSLIQSFRSGHRRAKNVMWWSRIVNLKM